MNTVILSGRLTKDPEVRYTPAKKARCAFALAVADGKDKDGNKKTQFLPCVAWEDKAEFLDQYFIKGDGVAVTGKLTSRSYEKDGKKQYVTEVLVSNIEFPLGKPKGETYGTEKTTADAFEEFEDDDAGLPF